MIGPAQSDSSPQIYYCYLTHTQTLFGGRARAGTLFFLRLVSETGVRRVESSRRGNTAHDDYDDANDHEEDEAKNKFVRSHATHKSTHLQHTA
jgi:hypothetical protein